ncbi:hypothetical protein [Christiangramia sp. SM2212]|uniref:LAGLIDADG homing endonuclease n=1 Tax=Christiangramia sediminicola TaxID=3073267 RepID=A0ABU1ES40_9FLAO|nr:hypothetical protein [Christiangramia sp. SM2212]MDR5591206.1 hypothetical protein [Christiangramia sp. SM2212]
METNGIKFHRHIYQKSKGRNSNISIFEKVNNNIHKSLLPERVTLQKPRNKRELSFCVEDPANWRFGSRVSELLETHLINIFEGNLLAKERKSPEPGTLMFCELASNEKILVIDIFPEFYTHNPFVFRLLLEKHEFLLRKKPGSK